MSLVGSFFQAIIRFENGKWIQKTRDKNGKESMGTRWVDENDQQHIVGCFEYIFFIHEMSLTFRFWSVVKPKFIDSTSACNR
jgi:hypothetical protein